MAKNTSIGTAVANQQADLLARALDDGYVRIYSGAQPVSADAGIGSAVLLAELRLEDPCAPAAVNGVITFEAPGSVFSVGAGTATWFRLLAADGTTAVVDGTVGIAADTPNLIVPNVDVTVGQLILITNLSHSVLRSWTGL